VTRTPDVRVRGRSLRWRLALWYGALTGGMVILTCVYSYAVHARTHYDEADAMLERVATHVALEVARAPDAPGRMHVIDASRLLATPIRLFARDGGTMVESPGVVRFPTMTETMRAAREGRRPYSWLVARAPATLSADADSRAQLGLVRVDGMRWRVRVSEVPGSEYLLSAYTPLARLDSSVAQFARLMTVMAITGALAGWAMGWLVAGRALRPVAVLAAGARRIAEAGDFSQRLPEPMSRDELSELAQVFNAMLRSLDEAIGVQQRFIADASHELRAPLAIIRGNLEILRDATRLPPSEQRNALLEAHDEAERLSRLVVDLLTLARADAGVPPNREVLELHGLLMKVCGDARKLSRGQRLELGLVSPATVRGDRDLITQLLLIILDNAIRYTPASGRVTASLACEGGSAVIRVADTGVGIAHEDLPHVFDRFFRADPARSRDPRGTGLGLAIARWIVRQHSGEIHVASEVEVGTTVSIRLPLAC
jgi:two-component system, OmpR family, sensor kinase